MGVVFCARPVAAETLVEALSNAYLINPVLNAERANLRATDEQVAVAKSGLRPNISASGDAAFQNQESDIVGGSQKSNVQQCDAATAALEPAFCASLASQTNIGNIENQLSSDGVTHPRGYSVNLTQTIFDGFQNINAIRQAKSTVQAGREGLRATEQTTLLNAVTAYVDVVRDQAVVRLRQTNVDVLTEQLRQTKDRFDVGEVTRTDVAQAEARRSDSITQLYAAQANYKTSRATYEQVIGHPPSSLVHPPSIAHLLPSQLEDAMTLGDGQNPFILAAVYQEEASLYNVAQIEGELLPEVTLDARYSQRFGLSNTLKEQQVTTVMGRVNVPLYQGGGVAARIRQAKETNNQLKKEVEDARLRIHAEVIANWAQLQATASEIQSAQDALEANRIALEGVREEEKVGQRTTLDVLNAELEYLGSQIQLVTAKRDRVVAEYAIYGSVGRLDAQSLGLSVPYYDPLEHYNIVKNKWFGLTPPAPPAPDE
ncbi:TolC family outer membrane protein [Methyloceanibacter sp.]|uniref:TolC family outer membrane protein n=1 Tax=Methyloceanibacter sp. TaxID=1965321 RepID=UPI003D6CAA0E